jgi:N-acyl-D-amino-acid deacylase
VKIRRIIPLFSVPFVLALALELPRLAAQSAAAKDSFVILNARIADGTGQPLRAGGVRVEGGGITAVGRVKPRKGETVVEAGNLVLAPGFIDTHNHSDRGIANEPLAVTQISQGLTTLLLGQDGGSMWPIGEYLEERSKNPPAVNVMTMVGHATLRRRVMGDDFRRTARPEEIAAMEKLVEQGMKEGAAGLSSGLEYEVGSYAATEEVIALARVAARFGGFYISHTRDEADKSFDSMREVIRIGREAKIPVQNTHIKLGTTGVWGKAAEAVRLYDEARKSGVDVTADCYPYGAWQSNMKVLVPSKRWDDPADVKQALDVVGGARNITITHYPANPAYEGRNMEEIAASRGISPVALYMEMVKHDRVGVIGHTMIEPDIRTFFQWKWTMVSSDGGVNNRHPRGAGTYPRVLGRYVRELRWLRLEDAIRKMTSLPAWRLGLRDRGRIKKGFAADLVLFNPDTVMDIATFAEPQKLSTGIEKVWVNGQLVWSNGAATGARPGLAIRH